MSEENVELIRGLQPGPDVDVAALMRDDIAAREARAAVEPLLDERFEAVARVGVQRHHAVGVEGLRAVWLDWLEPWESYRAEIEDLIDAGDQVVVLTRDFGRPVGAEREVAVSGAAVWTVRAGKIVRAEFFSDRAEALEAAGLSE